MKTAKNAAVTWKPVVIDDTGKHNFRPGRLQAVRTVSFPADLVTKGNLILVNAMHPFQTQVEESQLTVPFPDQPLHRMEWEASLSLQGLLRSLQSGRRIVGVSGYRTMEEQTAIWKDSEAENGLEFTRKFVAVPGHSEHQTGLAMDVALNQKHIDFICPQFPYEGICQEFRRLAADYGFVERYPAGKEDVTGIGAEPWHFRYVGIPHARLMRERDMVLEEYVDWIRAYRWNDRPYRCWNEGKEFWTGWLPCTGDGKEIQAVLPEHCRYIASGNNVDGIILTASVL